MRLPSKSSNKVSTPIKPKISSKGESLNNPPSTILKRDDIYIPAPGQVAPVVTTNSVAENLLVIENEQALVDLEEERTSCLLALKKWVDSLDYFEVERELSAAIEDEKDLLAEYHSAPVNRKPNVLMRLDQVQDKIQALRARRH